MIGKRRKREIAFILATFLERDQHYSSLEIEAYIQENVKSKILEEPSFALDHLRVAMIDNGFLNRNPTTNEYWVADDFEGAHDSNVSHLARYKQLMTESPNIVFRCEFCGRDVNGKSMLNHFLKRHALVKHWERLIDRYFGW